LSEPMKTELDETESNSEEAADQRIAAFFDLDRTIIAKAAMSAFKSPLLSHGLLTRRAVLSILLGEIIYLHLGATRTRIEHFGKSGVKLIRGKRQSEISEAVEEVLNQVVEPIIYAEALELIDAHKKQNHLVILVSASPEEIVNPLAKLLGADMSIASRAHVDSGGYYTGSIDFLAIGTNKADAIAALAKKINIDLKKSYAFSDSIADVPMLEMVGHPVAINPDRALEKLAEIRGWDMDEFVQPINLSLRLKNVGEAVMDKYATTDPLSHALALYGPLATAGLLFYYLLRKTRKRGFEPQDNGYLCQPSMVLN